MNNYFKKILLTLILFLTLSGCDSLSPTPAMEMSVVTPEVEMAQPAEPSIPLDELDMATQNTLNLLKLIVQSENDIAQGKVTAQTEMFEDLEKKLFD